MVAEILTIVDALHAGRLVDLKRCMKEPGMSVACQTAVQPCGNLNETTCTMMTKISTQTISENENGTYIAI